MCECKRKCMITEGERGELLFWFFNFLKFWSFMKSNTKHTLWLRSFIFAVKKKISRNFCNVLASFNFLLCLLFQYLKAKRHQKEYFITIRKSTEGQIVTRTLTSIVPLCRVEDGNSFLVWLEQSIWKLLSIHCSWSAVKTQVCACVFMFDSSPGVQQYLVIMEK